MQETIDILLKYGYVLLFVYSLGGGMVAILAAGVLSSTNSEDFNLSICISLAFVANIFGSTLLFILGKYYKKDIMPYLKNHSRKVALARIKMKQYGAILIFIQKFIYGLKTFIPIAAGFAHFSFVKFFVINTLASLIWAVGFGYIGFAFGFIIAPFVDNISEKSFLIPLFLLALIMLFWFYLHKFSKKV